MLSNYREEILLFSSYKKAERRHGLGNLKRVKGKGIEECVEEDFTVMVMAKAGLFLGEYNIG